jgi:hypothetical protein
VRLIFAWTGVALFYGGAALVMVVGVWFFVRVIRGARVAELPGLMKLAIGLITVLGAASIFGMGLTVASLDSVPLVALGIAVMLLGIWIGAYAVRIFRMPAEIDIQAQFKRLTSRTIILGQVVALVGLIPVLGVYFYLTEQRVIGMLLIGAPIATSGVLLERLSDSLLRQPLVPRALLRFLTGAGIVIALLAVVVFVVQ